MCCTDSDLSIRWDSTTACRYSVGDVYQVDPALQISQAMRNTYNEKKLLCGSCQTPPTELEVYGL